MKANLLMSKNKIISYITTIGIDYGVKKINYNDSLLAINIFDLSGDDDYKYVRKQFYNEALVLLY